MKCPRCQQDNPSPASFCPGCGTPLGSAVTPAGSYADLQAEIEGLRRMLGEAVEQQTATSEILRVIVSSRANLQSVLNTVVQSAARLCEAYSATLILVDGDVLHIAANYGPLETSRPEDRVPLTRGSVAGRSIIDRQPTHVLDLANADEAEFPLGRALAARFGHRTTMAAPLLHEGTPLGTIVIRRREVRSFSDRQIMLLQTFADQAVIAIENVRLFTELDSRNRELTEAFDQQTATSEILRVISSSPTDVQPIFEAIVTSGRRLCDAEQCALVGYDGETLTLLATNNFAAEGQDALRRAFPYRANRSGTAGRAVLDRAVVHIPDVMQDSEYAFKDIAQAAAYRAHLGIPVFREADVIGVLIASRSEPGPFSQPQIELLKTFADQAVIAIENVRLFNETKEALERQTATSEILRVISSSPTDVQPVFDTIVANAVRLCHGNFGAVHRYDGEFLHLVAHHNIAGEALEHLRGLSPRTPGKAVRERRVVLIADFEMDPDVPEAVRIGARLRGSRSNVTVPMLRDDNCLGVIVVGKRDPGLFPDEQVQLLQTFADQAVIAIENVRLFTELQEKNRALTAAHAQVSEALGQQTATAEILKVISSSPTDLQPTMDAVAENAALVCGASDASIFRVEGDELRRVARFGSLPMNMPAAIPLSRTFPAARSIIDRQTIHVDDFAAVIDNEFPGVAAVRTAAGGIRTLLATPLMREGVPIGAILIRRTEVRPFTTEQVALLETFADQAVIAIENVRLFSELQARTADLTRSVDRLTALSEVGRAVSSTLDLDTVLQTIVSRAVQLTGTDGGSIYEYDAAAEEFEIRATRTAAEEIVEAQRFIRLRKGEGVVGQLANTKQAVQVPDITAEGAYSSRMRGTLIRAGVHSLLAVPLLRDDELIGALVVTRGQAGTFAVETIELLRTFATQSALAIQNARLFHEIEDKSRQLETASQHKSEFLANMSHELRTPLNAIIGFSEVLGERLFGELNEKQDEYLKDIHASGQHLLSLINDILDLSKIEAGRMELELTDFDLPTAIDNALTLVRERAGRRGISLHQAADEGLGQIQGDERKIKQVLLNLLSNAIKFTPEAGRIEVRAKAVDRSVEVSVSDTGVGIAPEDQEAIFEEFRQVGTADKKVEGTGLGLALSRKFIELHGGRIWVQSQVGVGSTFSFTIPMRTGP